MHSSDGRLHKSPVSRCESGDLGVNWLAWAKLVRLPNVPTAAADVLAGYFVARAIFPNDGSRYDLVILVIASCCLYMAGMIWNDWFDLEIDIRERPFRPLPSGAIGATQAFRMALALTMAGTFLPAFVGSAPTVIAMLLTTAILGYNMRFKHGRWSGPIVMGLCRSLNLLLGMAVSVSARTNGIGGFPSDRLPLEMAVLSVANGIYIAGVTWFARSEASESSKRQLVLASLQMGFGLSMHIASVVFLTSDAISPPFIFTIEPLLNEPQRSPGFVGYAYLTFAVILAWLLIWIIAAIRDPKPVRVQQAVKWSILSLILINAHSLLAVDMPWHALATAFLILPSILLGRWIYST